MARRRKTQGIAAAIAAATGAVKTGKRVGRRHNVGRAISHEVHRAAPQHQAAGPAVHHEAVHELAAQRAKRETHRGRQDAHRRQVKPTIGSSGVGRSIAFALMRGAQGRRMREAPSLSNPLQAEPPKPEMTDVARGGRVVSSTDIPKRTTFGPLSMLDSLDDERVQRARKAKRSSQQYTKWYREGKRDAERQNLRENMRHGGPSGGSKRS